MRAKLEIVAMFVAAVAFIVSLIAIFLSLDAISRQPVIASPYSDPVLAYAYQFHINMTEFQECLEKENVYDKWMQDAKALGVRGTPTFIINGRKIEGNQPNLIKQTIEEELQNPSPHDLWQYVNKDIILGNKSAPVLAIEVSSFTCPHCRAFHKSAFPEIKESYIDTGKIAWVPKILGDKKKSNAIYCFYLQRPDKVVEYIDLLFE
ncbi:MAG: thioredoxin domain-containing protein [Candidatus Micrarchaeota archaeon]|nr:thioredoxin domain-containing protein [Candidatus Micrarchaeota archaeon]